MSGSVGVSHSAINDIKILRDLVSRYHLGFPILKEVVQNADDAGATQLDIGFVNSFGDVSHPLLKGPALFIFNNGPFSRENERAIRHIGSTDKASRQSAIGKFGYGLKSVFHLCEAFFYLYSKQSPTHESVFPLGDAFLFNPWKGASHAYPVEWDNFSSENANAVITTVERIIGEQLHTQHWFGLCLPLRKHNHLSPGVKPIAPEFYGDSKVPPSFLNDVPEIARRFADTMPLLASLTSVRIWLPDQLDRDPQLALTVEEEPGSLRRKFLGARIDSGYQPIHGRIRMTRPANEDIFTVFAGVEQLLDLAAFSELKQKDEWPSDEEEDVDTGDFRVVPDKALPHAAAIFSASPRGSDGKLTVSHAVFLPVGEDPEASVPCHSKIDVDLVLHGYYFVNSDRTGIEWGDPEGVGDDSGRALRRQWNNLLLGKGSLNCLLPALSQFVATTRLSDTEISGLTRAMQAVPLFQDRLADVCVDYQWLYRLDANVSGEWILTDSSQPIYLLPRLPQAAPAIHLRVFPTLGKACGGLVVSFEDRPRIAAGTPVTWSEEALHTLLRDVPATEVFTSPDATKYLSRFLDMNGDVVRASTVIQSSLVTLMQIAIRDLGLSRINSPDFLHVLGLIDSDRLVSIPVDLPSKAAVESTFSFLAGLQSRILILPHEILASRDDPLGRGPSGQFEVDEAQSVLGELARAPSDLEKAPSFVHLRTNIAMQIVRSTGDGSDLRGLAEIFDCSVVGMVVATVMPRCPGTRSRRAPMEDGSSVSAQARTVGWLKPYKPPCQVL